MTEHSPYLAVRRQAPENRSGAPVILIHGLMSSGERDFPDARWAKALTDAGREVAIVDLPGHGGSARVEDNQGGRPSKVAAALADLVAELGSPVDIVGYSAGARMAWAFAAQKPDLVNKLVLGGLAPFEPFATFDFKTARAHADGGPAPTDPQTGMITGMVVGNSPDPHSTFNFMEGLAVEPFDPAAEAPVAPTLLAGGADDPMAGNIEVLVPHIAGSRAISVPGDHFGALGSDEFRAEALAFLGVNA
ncbi:alpha/beta fold hydrolase [Cucumibacter marinus]|uniref:alpha/beta fold hydrolase n=1 Tax=Cucumibacter marinus TaxID=1121252 RepID=UPI0003FC4A00|nr:alpha/beta fold hydrolase [Cucumibacter marinus]